ncbi:MGMT family protein [Fimicolochytrium jonesii]|uniref:MGMT family protein n=1 Tax=Fimicolochytrium jonesii TaxID=1396493 RepID=UPI0022FE94C9|nr:MGMT family protein [Fimicolochytrium jonesii]KAI8823008.1 MGMT family protein [Fimicolochytrium jonesii]
MSDRDEFKEQVYSVVQRIPKGRVTSYGHIAKLINHPRHARHVGTAMRESPPNLPWQRVVSFQGKISPRVPLDNCARQAQLLRQEGVVVEADEMGLFCVDLTLYGWFPAEAAGSGDVQIGGT